MKNPIVALVEKEVAAFQELRQTHPSLFSDNPSLYPIPFFGDIRRAEVVTLALNPAHTEFLPLGRWPTATGASALTSEGLTNRLLSYFHARKYDPHGWFDECEKGLLALGCSYQRNAAHVDVHPFPTKFASQLNHEGIATLGEIIRTQGANHLLSVLELCERVKFIAVIEYTVPLGGVPATTTFEFVRDRLSPLAGLVDVTGVEPPVVRGGDHKKLADYLFGHRSRLRSFLLNAPSLIFSS